MFRPSVGRERLAPGMVQQISAVHYLEPRRRFRDLNDASHAVEIHVVSAINRRVIFGPLHQADKRIAPMLSGINLSLLPYVAVGEIEELEILTGEVFLDGLDERTRNCIVVVQPGCDEVRKSVHKIGNRRSYHGLVEHAVEIDWPERFPFAESLHSFQQSDRHSRMTKNNPVEIGIRLAVNGWKTEALEEVEAMLQPIPAWRRILLDSYIETRQDEMPEPGHETYPIRMPGWSIEELRKAAVISRAIDGCRAPRRKRRIVSPLDLSLRAAVPLFDGLGGGTRAVLVRQFLRDLGFDECSHLEWRLEHKLVQALVLHSYLPDAVPVTRGFAAALFGQVPDNVRPFLNSEFPRGYVIKAALGDSSGESPNGAGTVAIQRNPQEGALRLPEQLIDEEYVIQEQICIAQEYRIHSLEDLVIEDLTFHRYGGGSIPGERNAPNAFVQSALHLLPDAMVGGSLLAWDVALTPDGGFAIVEVNFSGFHPVYKRGFHCSGYFHDYNWGACDTARLLNHVARRDDVDVVVHADAPDYPEENRFYADVANWQRRHQEAAALVCNKL